MTDATDADEASEPPVPPAEPPAEPVAAPVAAPAATEPARRRSPLVAVTAVTAVLGLAVGILVVLLIGQGGDVDDLRAERAERREVARVAAAFGEAYLTYDFDDVDASSAAVKALATESFASKFEETSAPGIEDLFASLKTSTRASTDEVFVGDVEGDRARALVVVDVAASSTASGDQELSDLSFVLDLERTDDGWHVNAVAPAPQPDISGGAADEPTTTAPAAPSTTAAP